MSYMDKLLEFNNRKFILKRTIKESSLKPNVNFDEIKEYYHVETILRKDGILYLCNNIDEAEII